MSQGAEGSCQGATFDGVGPRSVTFLLGRTRDISNFDRKVGLIWIGDRFRVEFESAAQCHDRRFRAQMILIINVV
ncbi:hypothetical protein NL676_011233 [Syzygium grande]|nr:hypothetical protein NL676_011233 [Syzygium grande]